MSRLERSGRLVALAVALIPGGCSSPAAPDEQLSVPDAFGVGDTTSAEDAVVIADSTAPNDAKADVAPDVKTDTKPSDAACTPLGSFCDPGSCCEGACDPRKGLCSSGEGGYCDPSKPNPDAYCAFGFVCDTSTSKCTKMKCVSTMYELICGELALPCCDPVMNCTSGSSPGLFRCCAPDGTIIKGPSEVWKCCSPGVTTSDTGVVKCGMLSPGT